MFFGSTFTTLLNDLKLKHKKYLVSYLNSNGFRDKISDFIVFIKHAQLDYFVISEI